MESVEYLDEQIGSNGIANTKNNTQTEVPPEVRQWNARLQGMNAIGSTHRGAMTVGNDLVRTTYGKNADNDYLSNIDWDNVVNSENPQEAIDERIAELQSNASRFGNALLNNSVIALTTAADGIVGTAYGLLGALVTQSADFIWDNHITKAMNNLRTASTENNFVSRIKAYNDAGLWDRMKTGVFWADMVQNLGYTEGMILGSVTPFGATGAAMNLLGKGSRAAAAMARLSRIHENTAKALGYNVAEVISGKILPPVVASLGEAATEAISNYEDKVKLKKQKAFDRYLQLSDVNPALQEANQALLAKAYDDIENDERQQGNVVMGMNMVILGLSNMTGSFSGLLQRGYDTGRRAALNIAWDKAKKLGKGEIGFSDVIKLQNKPLHYAKATGKGILEAIPEGLEEGAQDFATYYTEHIDGWNRFYHSELNPDKEAREKLISNANKLDEFKLAMMQAYADAMNDKNFSTDVMSGIITGLTGAPTIARNKHGKYRPTWGGGILEQYSEEREKFRKGEEFIEQMKSRFDENKWKPFYTNVMRQMEINDRKIDALLFGDKKAYKDADVDGLLSDFIAFDEAGQGKLYKELISSALDFTDEEYEVIAKGDASSDAGNGKAWVKGTQKEKVFKDGADAKKKIQEKAKGMLEKFDKYSQMREKIKIQSPFLDSEGERKALYYAWNTENRLERIKDIDSKILSELKAIWKKHGKGDKESVALAEKIEAMSDEEFMAAVNSNTRIVTDENGQHRVVRDENMSKAIFSVLMRNAGLLREIPANATEEEIDDINDENEIRISAFINAYLETNSAQESIDAISRIFGTETASGIIPEVASSSRDMLFATLDKYKLISEANYYSKAYNDVLLNPEIANQEEQEANEKSEQEEQKLRNDRENIRKKDIIDSYLAKLREAKSFQEFFEAYSKLTENAIENNISIDEVLQSFTPNDGRRYNYAQCVLFANKTLQNIIPAAADINGIDNNLSTNASIIWLNMVNDASNENDLTDKENRAKLFQETISKEFADLQNSKLNFGGKDANANVSQDNVTDEIYRTIEQAILRNGLPTSENGNSNTSQLSQSQEEPQTPDEQGLANMINQQQKLQNGEQPENKQPEERTQTQQNNKSFNIKNEPEPLSQEQRERIENTQITFSQDTHSNDELSNMLIEQLKNIGIDIEVLSEEELNNVLEKFGYNVEFQNKKTNNEQNNINPETNSGIEPISETPGEGQSKQFEPQVFYTKQGASDYMSELVTEGFDAKEIEIIHTPAEGENDDYWTVQHKAQKSSSRIQGTVFGFTKDGKIYINKDRLNPNTLIHEWTHLWCNIVKQGNPKLWENIKTLLQNDELAKKINEELNLNANYKEISNDRIIGEIIARLSGQLGRERLEKIQNQLNGETKNLFDRLIDSIREFWNWIGTNIFQLENISNVDELVDRVLYDMINGINNNSQQQTNQTPQSNTNEERIVENKDGSYSLADENVKQEPSNPNVDEEQRQRQEEFEKQEAKQIEEQTKLDIEARNHQWISGAPEIPLHAEERVGMGFSKPYDYDDDPKTSNKGSWNVAYDALRGNNNRHHEGDYGNGKCEKDDESVMSTESAFDYINLGKLKEGDDLFFMVDKEVYIVSNDKRTGQPKKDYPVFLVKKLDNGKYQKVSILRVPSKLEMGRQIDPRTQKEYESTIDFRDKLINEAKNSNERYTFSGKSTKVSAVFEGTPRWIDKEHLYPEVKGFDKPNRNLADAVQDFLKEHKGEGYKLKINRINNNNKYYTSIQLYKKENDGTITESEIIPLQQLHFSEAQTSEHVQRHIDAFIQAANDSVKESISTEESKIPAQRFKKRGKYILNEALKGFVASQFVVNVLQSEDGSVVLNIGRRSSNADRNDNTTKAIDNNEKVSIVVIDKNNSVNRNLRAEYEALLSKWDFFCRIEDGNAINDTYDLDSIESSELNISGLAINASSIIPCGAYFAYNPMQSDGKFGTFTKNKETNEPSVTHSIEERGQVRNATFDYGMGNETISYVIMPDGSLKFDDSLDNETYKHVAEQLNKYRGQITSASNSMKTIDNTQYQYAQEGGLTIFKTIDKIYYIMPNDARDLFKECFCYDINKKAFVLPETNIKNNADKIYNNPIDFVNSNSNPESTSQTPSNDNIDNSLFDDDNVNFMTEDETQEINDDIDFMIESSKEEIRIQKNESFVNDLYTEMSQRTKDYFFKGIQHAASQGFSRWQKMSEGLHELGKHTADENKLAEAFHAAYEVLLTEQEKQQIMKEFTKTFGNPKSNALMQKRLYEAYDDFIMNGKEDLNLGQHTRQFFKSVKTKSERWLRPIHMELLWDINYSEPHGDNTFETLEDLRRIDLGLKLGNVVNYYDDLSRNMKAILADEGISQEEFDNKHTIERSMIIDYFSNCY